MAYSGAKSKGKRGGMREIYYLVDQDEIFMLYAYAKSKQEDISQDRAKILRDLVDQHLKP
jgi:hypothetical protein